jgi:hypothetical protein
MAMWADACMASSSIEIWNQQMELLAGFGYDSTFAVNYLVPRLLQYVRQNRR